MKKKFLFAALLLALLVFAIPIEHKYDRLFRHFSLTLIPDGLEISKAYYKKIYFYISDLIALVLLFAGLFWFKIPLRPFFGNPLWIVFVCAVASIIASPFVSYPIPYIRLLQLLTPLILFSFLANAFNKEEKEKITHLMLWTFVVAALFQTGIAIAQYFHQGPLGLHLIGELSSFSEIPTADGKRWLFDAAGTISGPLMRASGTFPHPNVLGGFLTLSILATYNLIIRGNKWLGLTLPFQFFAMTISYSRSAFFGLALGTGLWFAGMLYKKERVRFIGLMIAISVGVSGILLYEQMKERGGIVNYNSVAQGSDQIRIEYQNTALEILKDRPLLGLGFSQFTERVTPYLPLDADAYTRSTAPHNIFLFLACETGLISLSAFLLFIAFTLRFPVTRDTATLGAIFIAFLFIGCCDFYPILYQQGKLMFFLIAGLLFCRRREVDPSREEVWKMFDRISPTYDRVNRVLSLGMDQRWRKKVAKLLPERANLKILDVATGTGDQALALLKSKASIHSITGIDLSSEMLEIAKKKVGDQMEFLRADAEKLPFPDASFDAATFSFGIRNVTEPLSALKDLYRVLKPSGRCLILEFSLPPWPIRGFYLFYLRHILPRLGGLLSRDKNAYRYLNETIEYFPSGKAFSALLEEAGFCRLKRVPMVLGGVTLYVGEKP